MSKKIRSLRVTGMNPEYNDPKYITPINQIAKSLRFWQPKAYEYLKDSRFAMIAAFCGSGKSILLVSLAIHDVIKSNYSQKQLIVVPQSHIGNGFTADGELEYMSVMVEGEKYEWKVTNNFCDANNKDVLVRLKKWLLQDSKTLSKKYRDHQIMGLNCVASHIALGLVWNGLTSQEKDLAIKNLTLNADEAHHAKGIFDIEEDEDSGGLTDIQKQLMEQESTTLGEICRHIFNSNDKTSQIRLATATPYRGDRGIILSTVALEKFDVYYLDWIEHFKTLGIEKFFLEYEEYSGDPIKQVVESIASELKEKHMVVIPSTTQKWRKNGKEELEKLLSEIYKIVPKERVLDLVTHGTQSKNKELLLAEPKNSEQGESKFDIIVTCMLGREGTDWCPCSRLHNTACEGSVTLAIQTAGRVFRRFEGKREVRITYYIPKFNSPEKGMTKRELLSDRTNALLVCMQLDEMCHPIILPELPTGKKEEQGAEETKKKSKTSLQEVFGDQYQDVKAELIEEVECLEKKTKENIYDIIDTILEKHNITENADIVRDALVAQVLRVLSPELKDLGIDIKFLRENGFDKIIEEYDIENKSIFFGECEKKDWGIIRDIIRNYWIEQVKEIKRIGIKNVKKGTKLYGFMKGQRRQFRDGKEELGQNA